MSGAWVAGYNMPGYLPEMEPYAAPDFESAKRFLIDEMERDCDQYDEQGDHDLANELSGVEQDLNLASEGEWGDTIGNIAYWITFDADAENVDATLAEHRDDRQVES